MLFLVILLLLLFSYRVSNFLKEELISCGEYLITDFSRASELGVSAEDPVLIRPFIDALFEREDVILTALYNHRGMLLFCKKEPGICLKENIDPQIGERLKNEKEVLRIETKTEDGLFVYEFYAPIFTSYIKDKDEVIGFYSERLKVDKPVKKEDGKIEYTDILAKFRNPLSIGDELFKPCDFSVTDIHFYHYHALPPVFENKHPKLFRELSLELEKPNDWRGYLMASAFVIEAKKTD